MILNERWLGIYTDRAIRNAVGPPTVNATIGALVMVPCKTNAL